MTPLMMLALTLPPSLAFVLERWMRGREEQARRLAREQVQRIDSLATAQTIHEDRLDSHRQHLDDQERELKRLNEQLSLVADRYR